MNNIQQPTNPIEGLQHMAINLSQQLAKGNYQNLPVTKLGNSYVLVISPKVMEFLSLEIGSRVMVIPYE